MTWIAQFILHLSNLCCCNLKNIKHLYINSSLPDSWNCQHDPQVLSSHHHWTSHNNQTKLQRDCSSCWNWKTVSNQFFTWPGQKLKILSKKIPKKHFAGLSVWLYFGCMRYLFVIRLLLLLKILIKKRSC